MPRFDNLELDPPADDARGTSARRADDTDDEGHWLRIADENRRQGHYDNALRYYSRALERDKALVSAWLGQVQMLIAMEEYPEAQLWSRKALELFRNHGDLLAAQAQALARLGERGQALAVCDAALKQDGQSAYRWMVRGELLVLERQDIDRHCFDKALLADPDWLVPLEIAAIYMHHGVPAKALPRYRQALERAPDNPHIWYRKALCEQALDLRDSARKSLRRCLELSPSCVDAAHALAKMDNRRSWFKSLLDQLPWWK
jgi:tetratricopeptide (TPR) repeat protein